MHLQGHEADGRDVPPGTQRDPVEIHRPSVPTRFVLCTEDRFFPPDFMRRVVSTVDWPGDGGRPVERSD
jgi:hypothetical protein